MVAAVAAAMAGLRGAERGCQLSRGGGGELAPARGWLKGWVDWLEVDAIAGSDDLDRAAATLAAPDAFGDVWTGRSPDAC
jgi:hypothetical protein